MPHLRNSFIVAKVGLAAFLLAVLHLNAQQSATLSTGQTLTATVTPTTILYLGHRRISLKRDNTVAPSTKPALKLIAELPGKVILLTDTYPSRTMSLSRCQAGEEQFLRVIALMPSPKETYRLKLASCRDNIDLFEDEGLKWSPTAKTLTVHWITPPIHPQLPEMLVLQVNSDGHVAQLPYNSVIR